MQFSRTRTRPLSKEGTKSGGSSGSVFYSAEFSWSWTKSEQKRPFLGTTIIVPAGRDSSGTFLNNASNTKYIEDQVWAAYLAYYSPRALAYAKTKAPTMAPSYTMWAEESFSDTPTPGFKKLAAAGDVIVTDCYKTSHVVRHDHISAAPEVKPPKVPRFEKSVSLTGGYLRVEQAFAYSMFEAEMPERVAQNFWSITEPTLDVDMSTVSDAYGNMQAYDFQNLVDLGEFRETMGTFSQGARRIATIYSQLRRGNFKQYAKRTAKKYANKDFEDKAQAISDAWLEARFAWRPIVMTVADGVRRVLETRTRTPRRTFRAKHERVETSDFRLTVVENGIRYEYSGTRTESCVNRAGILAEVDTNMGHSELQAELGLYDFAGTMWELAPYSFVVDWFVNINGLLYSICPSPVFKPLGSWLTTTSTVEIAGTVKCTVGDRSNTGMFSVYRQTKQRLANPDVPAIAWNPNLDFGKLLDAVSLLKRFVIFR